MKILKFQFKNGYSYFFTYLIQNVTNIKLIYLGNYGTNTQVFWFCLVQPDNIFISL